ncbi:metalloregulator ArsR/SmtB family transcription factor [Hyphomicrobium sp.]|uniref:ArsR/SmtB family transcription factor n=1 Tax=Hyphomicrobium sp. TaxID=82 RepID=UPI002D7909F5|nr:metalloregulator ArsR/SmtB family transcription factor [Hyphomicrobium sp.]HET6390672.1 metalloregulator ArsR/SmtB family transcription factor [Hyphomicrobium sp.]
MVEREGNTLDRVFHALADPSRRAILGQLATGERSVSELAEPLPISLAAVSKHIQVLEQSGLIHRSVQWRTHVCSLNAKPLAEAQRWLSFYEMFWNERFDALEDLFRAKKKHKK